MRSHLNSEFHLKRHTAFFSHLPSARFLCHSWLLFVALLWWEKKAFDDDEERASKFGLVFDIVYLMYATHSRAHHSLSLPSCRAKKIARLCKKQKEQKKSKWKSFKANFYVELTIFYMCTIYISSAYSFRCDRSIAFCRAHAHL